MKRVLLGLIAVGMGLAGLQPALADEKENAYLWKSHVTSVTVFKNGLGFYMREGEVQLRDGWCASDAVPPAAFGTLAIFSHKADETVDIVGSGPGEVVDFDGKDAPKEIIAKRTRLEGCKFMTVQLTYTRDGKDLTATGKIVSVGPEYVVLNNEGGSAAVELEGIKKLQVMDNPLRVHVVSDSGQAPAKTTLGMAYLRKGVTWIPEYTLKLLDDENAELTLRGTIINEAEDLVHCDVNFVVGVPNFMHTEQLAPIAVGQAIRTIGAAVFSNSNVSSQIMNRANVANDIKYADDSFDGSAFNAQDFNGAVGNVTQWEGAGSSDYTVYTRKDLTIRRGEKMIVTLFVKRIKYSHSYQWSPPSEVRHSLVLQNGTDTAWTTGPCLALSDENALSEDLLKYTPKGGKCEFPVTSAVNISHDQKEGETDRQLKAYSPNNRDAYYDLVTVGGTLELKNYGKKAAEVTVEIPIKGKPTSASDDGIIRVDTTNLKLTERTATIKWKVTVDAGGSKVLRYSYERYVPSN